MQPAPTIATMIEKAPHGGYVLKQITFEDSTPSIEVIAYRTTLPEITLHELAMKAERFKEAAWFAPPQPPQRSEPDPIDLPRVATGPGHEEPDPGLVEKIQQRMGYGNGRSVVAFLWLTAASLSMSGLA